MGLPKKRTLINRIKKHLHPLYDVRGHHYRFDNKDYYCGHSFPLLQLNSHFDFSKYKDEICSLYTFPKISKMDVENYSLLNRIKTTNSVSIHIRRGDLLIYNGKYYDNGYFTRAVDYIKEKIPDPVFFVFSDEKSRFWCKDNLRTLGIKDDKIFFSECNDKEKSYIDMQLMSCCKHNIITNSSFGWWACYLNNNPDKITISPKNTFKTIVSIE